MSSFNLPLYRNRTTDNTIALYKADGTGQGLNASDGVRVKIYRRNGATPDLDLSTTTTTNGSVLSITDRAAPAKVNMRINQADLASLNPGLYEIEISVLDSTAGGAIRHAQQGTLTLLGAGAGGIT